MGEYFVDITEKAENDILKIYKSGNKGDINKLNKILEHSTTPPNYFYPVIQRGLPRY